MGVSRSVLYYTARAPSDSNLAMMRLIDEQYTRTPFYGVERMKAWLQRTGIVIGHNRVRRLMRLMGLEALRQALAIARPEIFNTDQGSQFTSGAFTGVLEDAGVAISMDVKGRVFANIFVERLWRTVKYEEIYLKYYQDVDESRRVIGIYFRFYNQERLHQSLGYRTPAEVYFNVEKEISSITANSISGSLRLAGV